MPASKIQDESEVIRWFEEGLTYDEMSEIYRTKYNIETSQSLWAGFRRRRGLDRRINRDDELIPWQVKREHRWLNAPKMLRAEARRRAGLPIPAGTAERLEAFKARLKAEGRVVHYEPETEEGWFYPPRRPGIDDDLIRVPDKVTTERRRID